MTIFEDLSSELHISIFEYLNANELIESFYNLNEYFNRLLCDYHLLLDCALIDDENNIDILLSGFCLQQLKSLKCYDYHLIRFENPDQLSRIHSLVVFKYATNIREEMIIDFILGIKQLKYCQIKISQSHGRIELVPSDFHQNQEFVSSNLEYLDIDSKTGLSSSYFYSHVLRYSPNLRNLTVYLSARDGYHNTIYEPISELVHLIKLNVKIRSTKFEHLNILAQCTPNLKSLKLDCSAVQKDRSFMDAQKWFHLLSSWKKLKFLRISIQMKNNMGNDYLYLIQQTFKSIPFLIERHLCPMHSSSGYNHRRIHFNAYYQEY